MDILQGIDADHDESETYKLTIAIVQAAIDLVFLCNRLYHLYPLGYTSFIPFVILRLSLGLAPVSLGLYFIHPLGSQPALFFCLFAS